MVKLHIKWIFS